MTPINESVASFLDALASGLGELLSQEGADRATVSWTPRQDEAFRADLKWWSSGLSVDAACRLFAGAPQETWQEIGRGRETESENPLEDAFTTVVEALQRAAAERFGAEVSCTEAGSAEEPQGDWTAVTLEFSLGEISCEPMDFVLSPELVEALGGFLAPADSVSAAPAENMDPNAVDRLLHVEIPVSVSFGQTQLRMKDLLSLTHGSIVELEQELSDDVEVRVNNCVIARGEVVEVDGNYGVRILKMIGRENRTLPEAEAK